MYPLPTLHNPTLFIYIYNRKFDNLKSIPMYNIPHKRKPIDAMKQKDKI